MLIHNIMHGDVSVSENILNSCSKTVINITFLSRRHGLKLHTTPFNLDNWWGAVVVWLSAGLSIEGTVVQSHLPLFRNLGNFIHPTFACVFWKRL